MTKIDSYRYGYRHGYRYGCRNGYRYGYRYGYSSYGIPAGKRLQCTNLNMAIEIVDSLINSMVMFHSELLVYQRVNSNDDNG